MTQHFEIKSPVIDGKHVSRVCRSYRSGT